MERDAPLESDKVSMPENEKQRETEKGKKRKTYFTYWSGHDLENWDLQSQPTITIDELEEIEELEQLIEIDKKNSVCSNCNIEYSGEMWIYECLCVYECFCSYESLCAIFLHEVANV